MSIINCIVCGKKISSRAKSCSHCGAVFSQEGEIENLENAQVMQKLKKSSRLQTLSFISVIVFLLGILLWNFEGDITAYLNKTFDLKLQFNNQVLNIARYVLALGFVGYIASRFMIYFNKKK